MLSGLNFIRKALGIGKLSRKIKLTMFIFSNSIFAVGGNIEQQVIQLKNSCNTGDRKCWFTYIVTITMGTRK